MSLPIDTRDYAPLVLQPDAATLPHDARALLERNIALMRDLVVFLTGLAGAKGIGGHTGGAYDISPEILMLDALRRGGADLHPVFFDDAGHRVIAHYILAALDDGIPGLMAEDLLRYREHKGGLPGHHERDAQRGIGFSSGRLGHLWAYVNGVAMAHPGRRVVLLSTDGAQQEGGCAEAARFAVARGLPVTVVVDDNDTTISGHPSAYLKGYHVARTLAGHGLAVATADGENLDALYQALRTAILAKGPNALIVRRPIAPGILSIEGTARAHEAIPPKIAAEHLTAHGYAAAAQAVLAAVAPRLHAALRGCDTQRSMCREEFGKALCAAIGRLAPESRAAGVLVIDSDLAGSCGLSHVKAFYPEVFVPGGIMERHNFLAAAGFGSEPGRQGVFSTFSAFLEMVISEITMARLNGTNVLAHFSHAGVDEIADNNSHFGINIFFADNGLANEPRTRLYFPADADQMRAIVGRVFGDSGLRFIFSTRSSVPYILDERGERRFLAEAGYVFEPGKDELIRQGSRGYVVSYGDMLSRALDAVERAREAGIDVGLINKPTLNVPDEDMLRIMGAAPFVFLVESQSRKSGLGARMGSWLLERGMHPRFEHLGVERSGAGGAAEQVEHQGLGPQRILERIFWLAGIEIQDAVHNAVLSRP